MIFTTEHLGRRVQYTDRSNNISYGAVRDVAGNMVDINREGTNGRTYYVPMDMLVLVDEDGVPQAE